MSTGRTMARLDDRFRTAVGPLAVVKRLLLCGLCGLCVQSVLWAAPPARTMYTDALAREQSVRAALTAADATPAVLADVRALIATYESLVRHHPASGYSDDALWQAGRLALDAYARFGEVADRDAGVRLLRRLAAGYPSSKFVPQVPDQLAALPVDNAAPGSPGRKGPAARASAVGAPSTDAPPARTTESAAGTDPIAKPSAGRERIATIRDIRRTVLPDAVRVTIELDGEVLFHDERIADPDRVYLDLPGTRPSAALVDKTLRFAVDADVVRQVRIGRHPNNTTRVVLDAGGVSSYSVYPLYGPYRLVIDCMRAPGALSAELAHAPVPAPKPALLPARNLTVTWTRRFPSGAPANRAAIARARVVEQIATVAVAPSIAPVGPLSLPAPPTPPATTLPSKSTAGGLSIARQLGLGVSRIVIDPGHGGHDPGAKGKGVTEAELVLDVALRVEKLLEQVPGVDVMLTRRTDEFIPLPERTAIANREGADLFLSIHANASPNAQAHGIETYFLNFATNTSAAAVAARENAASTLAMGEMPDIVKAIALNNKVDESRDFATHVQRAMLERLRASNKTLKDLGVKQAPFVVLIGATMPSVLAEISFVTNPQEARLLKGNAYRQKIAESLFNAIRKYQTSLKGATTVALQ
jgi:N-acetylmuramoyl-L-alanine amidase